MEVGTIIREALMALFKLHEGRYLDTEHVADIEYIASHPPKTSGVKLPRADKADFEFEFPASPAHLNITLKSGEEIRFSGEVANLVWAAFQAAQKS